MQSATTRRLVAFEEYLVDNFPVSSRMAYQINRYVQSRLLTAKKPVGREVHSPTSLTRNRSAT